VNAAQANPGGRTRIRGIRLKPQRRRFVAPGDRDNFPLWLTVVCGVGGVIIGYYLAAALGDSQTRQDDLRGRSLPLGVDPLR
jgi:hypothetical protein